MQEIYIDVVFAANLLMDYLLLELVARFLRCRTSHRRCLAAAILGAFGSCLILCIDRKSTRLNSSHANESRMPSSA